MRKIKITRKLLKKLCACNMGIEDLLNVFPSGVTLYDDQQKNIPAVLRAFDAGILWRLGWLLSRGGLDGYQPRSRWFFDSSGGDTHEPCDYTSDTSQACAVIAECVRRLNLSA